MEKGGFAKRSENRSGVVSAEQVEQVHEEGVEWVWERVKERDEEWVSKSRGPTHRWPCAWRCLWRSRQTPADTMLSSVDRHR